MRGEHRRPGPHDDDLPTESGRRPDEVLEGLIHRIDLDGLVRLIEDRSAEHDWDGVVRIRDRAREAVRTGRQLWPAATLAEYRIALDGPAASAAIVLDDDAPAGRFTIGPLAEVAAQHHPWAELGPLLHAGPVAAIVAHERVVRGERVDAPDLPPVLDIPLALQPWEPTYTPAVYTAVGAEFPMPDLPARWTPLSTTAGAERIEDDVEPATRQLVEPWTTASNGQVDVAAVSGGRAAALGALGVRRARVCPLTPSEALAWIGWAGASGGAHGRRRGAAAGRFGAWWLLGAIADLLDDWPTPADGIADELGALAHELRWWRWDAHEPAGGWTLQLVIEDPVEQVSWAIACRDAA